MSYYFKDSWGDIYLSVFLINKSTEKNQWMQLAERLDVKLREWEPNIAAMVRERITEIIDLCKTGRHWIYMQSRAVEQEVLDLLDESVSQ